SWLLHPATSPASPPGRVPTSPALPPTSSRNLLRRPSTQTPRPHCRHTAPPYRPSASRLYFLFIDSRQSGSVAATTFLVVLAIGPFCDCARVLTVGLGSVRSLAKVSPAPF